LAVGALQVTDGAYDDTNTDDADTFVIITVTAGLKLKNSNLISPVALPAFSIGLATSRA
jgi:hypothetical protein